MKANPEPRVVYDKCMQFAVMVRIRIYIDRALNLSFAGRPMQIRSSSVDVWECLGPQKNTKPAGR
jgi:hypothetical protein